MSLTAVNDFPFPYMNYTSTETAFPIQVFGRLFSDSLNFVTTIAFSLWLLSTFLLHVRTTEVVFKAKLIPTYLAALTCLQRILRSLIMSTHCAYQTYIHRELCPREINTSNDP